MTTTHTPSSELTNHTTHSSSTTHIHPPITFHSPLPAAVWDRAFDVSAYSSRQLLEFGCAIFHEADCLEQLSSSSSSTDQDPLLAPYHITFTSLAHFLQQVHDHHHAENPYHGWTHGVHVLFNCYRFLRTVIHHFTKLERLTILLAAVCHDLQHSGMGNKWCVDHQYWMNPDHAAKKYTLNLLERNSVDRTIELLTGKPISVAFGQVCPLASASAQPSSASSSTSATPATATTPRNYLQDWGLSTQQRETLLTNLSEFILGTDLADRDRHQQLTKQFADLVAVKPTAESGTGQTVEAVVDEECEEDDCGLLDGIVDENKSFEHNRVYHSSDSTSSCTSLGCCNSDQQRQRPLENGITRKKIKKKSNFAFTFTSSAHRYSLTRVLLLCSDIGCVGELFPIAIAWADRLYEESLMGQSFIGHCSRSSDPAIAATVRKEASLPRPLGPSIYRTENDDMRPTSLTAAASSSNQSLSTSPSPITSCAALTAFFTNQFQFFSSYAVPLYLPLHTSGLISTLSERFYPQLKRNLQYMQLTDAVKPVAGKMWIEVRPNLKSTAETTALLRSLEGEFASCASFIHSLNHQQSDSTRPSIQPIIFHSTSTASGADIKEQLQPHEQHQHTTNGACRSLMQ